MLTSKIRFFKHYLNMTRSVKLTDYDVICFDLDNTLLHYNLTNLFPLQYKFMAEYLTDKKGYNKNVFTSELTESDIDFIQRGLFLDFSKGNVLHLRGDGYITKASHGTKLMDDSSIEACYGKERRWCVTDKFLEDLLSLWDCTETRTFMDFTDSLATVIFAKAIDSVDINHQPAEYKVWPDVLEAIVEMYKNESSFIRTVDSDLKRYMCPCEDDVLNWLINLRKHMKVFLISGAVFEVAQRTMPFCLGENYGDYFDIIIYNAKKPGFFTNSRPFLTIDDKQINEPNLEKEYKLGNWHALYQKLEKDLGKSPKCIYVGDSFLQDIFTPNNIPEKLDVIALVEEIAGEGLLTNDHKHPHLKYITSKFWGSLIYSSQSYTFMGNLVKNNAKLVIPSLKVLAEKPIDYEHKCMLNSC